MSDNASQRLLIVQAGSDIEALQSTIEQLPLNLSVTLLCASSFSYIALSIAQIDQVIVHRAIAKTGLRCDRDALLDLIAILKAEQFHAAMIVPVENSSPYAFAYLCYLAGIGIRVGQSIEFGGGVLSTCVQRSEDWLSALASLHDHVFAQLTEVV